MSEFKRSLVWIRRDLRIEDHHAIAEAGASSQEVAVVFVFDSTILNKLGDKCDRRMTFIYDSIMEVDKELKKKGSRLLIRFGDPTEEIPRIINEIDAQALFFNEDYEPSAQKRDQKVKKLLKKEEVATFSFKDQVIFRGDDILKPDETPYRVFTPYKKTWLKKLRRHDFESKPSIKNFVPEKKLSPFLKEFELKDLGFERAEIYLDFQRPGRKAALKRLKDYSDLIDQYHKTRDIPSLEDGTSGLSVHLRFGTLSIREVLQAAVKKRTQGSSTWLSELIWREFYEMILDQFPHVASGCFKQQYDQIKWPGRKSHFKSWCEGKTGFPLVDAGMRQLNQTGWMHNRVRMVTASFLVKDLHIDWRKGEKYFAEKLLDFDLSANNGGWQWSASTGCDAQPYFRIFNPVLQSKRFDPEGEYIREWVPELSDFSDAKIHCPWEAKIGQMPENFVLGKSYPDRIVDHSIQKDIAIDLFKNIS